MSKTAALQVDHGYNRFNPPKRLAFGQWTPREAQSYFEWFTNQIDERIGELRGVMEKLDARCKLDGSVESLLCLGEVLTRRIVIRQSTARELAADSREVPPHMRALVDVEEWQLSEVTISFCVDVGIYFAEVLRRHYPSIRWDRCRRKTVDYNRPVLVGFHGDVPVEPIRLAINIALGTARGKSQPGRLRELFEVWSGKVSG